MEKKLHELSTHKTRQLTRLEASLESYIIALPNIPRMDIERMATLVTAKIEETKAAAAGITGYPMACKITYRTKTYVIAQLYPADEDPPADIIIAPEYDYSEAKNVW